LSIWSNWE